MNIFSGHYRSYEIIQSRQQTSSLLLAKIPYEGDIGVHFLIFNGVIDPDAWVIKNP